MDEYEITPASIAVFARKITDVIEFGFLNEAEQEECAAALRYAAYFVRSYTGMDYVSWRDDAHCAFSVQDPPCVFTTHGDICYAIKVIAAEMIDNHQVTAQYTAKNPLVCQILDLHSTNLLPSVGG